VIGGIVVWGKSETRGHSTGANATFELSAEPGHHQNKLLCGKVPETVVLIPGHSPWPGVRCLRSRELRSLHHVERQHCSDRRDRMSIIGWIILGLVAGFIASKLVNHRGEGIILDIVLGIVGAIVGGWLFSFFGAAGVTGFNLYSMLVAVIGAVVVLVIYHAVVGRGATI